MQLRPRHLILLVIILGLFVWNIVRYRRARPSPTQGTAPVITTTPRASSPAWTAFDTATALRDAPDSQFDPAMKALEQQLAATPADPTVQDVKGCKVWLETYRQNIVHPSRDTSWKDRSMHHLNGCTKFHLDTTT